MRTTRHLHLPNGTADGKSSPDRLDLAGIDADVLQVRDRADVLRVQVLERYGNIVQKDVFLY